MSSKSVSDNPYFNDLPEPLPKDEQKDLARKFLNEDDKKAGKKLIRTNLRYVIKLALDYNRTDVDFNDLVQSGNLGLQKALQRFDPERGVDFTSYAFYWIRNEILNQIRMEETQMKISSTRGKKVYQNIRTAKEELEKYDLPVTDETIAQNLGQDVEQVQRVRSALNIFSANQKKGGNAQNDGTEQRTILSSIESDFDSPYELVQKKDTFERINDLLDEFKEEKLKDDRDLDIWNSRTLSEDPDTLQEISERWEVSQVRIYQLEDRIKDDLRDWIKSELDEDILD